MVERALAAAIVGAAIAFVIGTSSPGAAGVATKESCDPELLGVTAVPPQRGRALELSVGPTTGLVSGRPVEWELTITNHASRPVGFIFHSAMFGDVYLHAGGRQAALDLFLRDGPVYRWSENRGFAQPFIRAALPAHSAWRCSLPPSTLDVAQGRHLLVGYLNATRIERDGSVRWWARPIRFRRYVDVSQAP
jgi:Intracellular proteinase inhibitor